MKTLKLDACINKENIHRGFDKTDQIRDDEERDKDDKEETIIYDEKNFAWYRGRKFVIMNKN